MGVMGLMGLMGLMGCSEDRADDGVRLVAEGVPCAPLFVEEQGRGMTRSDTEWTPPSPYVTYDSINGMFEAQKDLTNKSISAYFTQNDSSPMEGTFFFRPTDKTWRLDMDIEHDGTYFLYGFIPKEDAHSSTITANGSYSSGAVLTIQGLNSVTPSDVCFIVGATKGISEHNDASAYGRLQEGRFSVEAKQTSPDGKTGNYIFLLFDHLYSALRFRFTVDPSYYSLRRIKLRSLELTSYADNKETGVKSKYNAEVTLAANNTGASPVVGDIVFTPDASSDDVSQVPIFNGEVDLPETGAAPAPDFMGCFVPGGSIYFKLRSTYDVYDTNGNLIRQGCQAVNSFNLRDKFGAYLDVMRGRSYSYSIVVQPTYLYVLSEPDLDNPTMIEQ